VGETGSNMVTYWTEYQNKIRVIIIIVAVIITFAGILVVIVIIVVKMI
jgi:hypothetical protein